MKLNEEWSLQLWRQFMQLRKEAWNLKPLVSNFFQGGLCVSNIMSIMAKVAKSVQKTELSSINDHGKSNEKLSALQI